MITKEAQLKALREHAQVIVDGLGAAFCNCVPCRECPFRAIPGDGVWLKNQSDTALVPRSEWCTVHIIEENLTSDSAS